MNGVTKGENLCDKEEGTSTKPEGTPGGGGAAVGLASWKRLITRDFIPDGAVLLVCRDPRQKC